MATYKKIENTPSGKDLDREIARLLNLNIKEDDNLPNYHLDIGLALSLPIVDGNFRISEIVVGNVKQVFVSILKPSGCFVGYAYVMGRERGIYWASAVCRAWLDMKEREGKEE